MFKDKNGNFIDFAAACNGHVFLMGTSGSGKTYAQYRLTEEDIVNKRKALILDSSSSFSEAEMNRAKFDYRDKNVGILNVAKCPIAIPVMDGCKDEEKILHMAETVLGISGKRQKDLIRKAAHIACKRENPSLLEVISILEGMAEMESETGAPVTHIKRIESLIEAFSPLAEGDFIDFWGRDGTDWASYDVVIIQLSELAEPIRKMLSDAVLWAIWIMTQKGKCPYQTIILDEIQHLDITAPIPSCIAREGRKYGLRLIMATQFVSGLDDDARSTFFMAANVLFFQPDRSQISKVARLIEPEREKEWQKILRNLEIGEAVLCGKYRINSNIEPCNAPVIVKIEKGIHVPRSHSQKKFTKKR